MNECTHACLLVHGQLTEISKKCNNFEVVSFLVVERYKRPKLEGIAALQAYCRFGSLNTFLSK